MKERRFFVEKKIDDYKKVGFTDQNMLNKARSVLRLKIGDMIVILDGTGREFHGKIKTLNKKELLLNDVVVKNNKVSFKRNITLASALIKKDKYEWVLQKGAETGVNVFIPLITERTEKVKLNMERMNKIVKGASEQSGRGNLPKIVKPTILEDFLSTNRIPVICFTQSSPMLDSKNIEDIRDVVVVIGPEGGFTEDEMDMFKKHNVHFFSLGKQTLRAETAAIVASSILQIF